MASDEELKGAGGAATEATEGASSGEVGLTPAGMAEPAISGEVAAMEGGEPETPPKRIGLLRRFLLSFVETVQDYRELSGRLWEFFRLGVLLVRKNKEYVIVGIPAFSELKRFREFLSKYAKRAGMVKRRISNVQLVVDEMVTNIIRHAYKGMEQGKIQIGAEWREDRFIVRIRDQGVEFDWNRVLNPDLQKYVEVKRKGGLGIMIIRKLTDDATYERLGDTNQTTLVFKLDLVEKKKILQAFFQEIAKRLSITSRFLLIGIIALSAITGVLYYFISQNLIERTQSVLLVKGLNAGKNLAIGAFPSLEARDSLTLNELVASVKENITGVKYAGIIDTNRMTLAHTDPDRIFVSDVDPPEEQILRRVKGNEIDYMVFRNGSRNDDEIVYDFTIPVQMEGRILGFVRIGIAKNSLDLIQEETRSRWQARILSGSLLVVVSLLLFYMGHAFVKPIRSFSEAISKIGTLDVDMEKIKKIRLAEFAHIEQTLSKMTGRIKEQELQLTDQTRIKREMQLAKDIQNTILPRVIPKTDGFELDGRYRSALEMGGDYYDFFEVGPNLMGIVVGDVSGKGIGAAFIMAIARMAMRSESRAIRRASDVLVKVDRLIRGDIKKGMYITVFYAVLDSEKRTISYASAGHNPMILYRGSEKAVYFLNPKGVAIGLALDEDFFKKQITSETITVQHDDLMFMYTDGITEAMNPQRKEYGEARLVEFIKTHAHMEISDFCSRLDADIEQFTKGYPQSDDITYIVVKAKPTPAEMEFEKAVRLFDQLKGEAPTPEILAEYGFKKSQFDAMSRKVKAKGLEALNPKPKFAASSGLSHATIEQSRKIITIVRNHPEYGTQRILKELASEAYGNELISENVLNKELAKLKLSTVKARRRYALRRIASTSVHATLPGGAPTIPEGPPALPAPEPAAVSEPPAPENTSPS